MPYKEVGIGDFTWFFKEADIDHDGYLSFKELKSMLKSYDYRGSDGDIRYMFTVTDADSDDRLSYEEFMEAMGMFPERLFLNMLLLRIFRKFDRNRNGEVDKKEFMSATKELGRHLTEEQVQDLIEEADMDNSQTLNYQEFCKGIMGLWSRCDILDMFFVEADTDADGFLSFKELKAMLQKIGYTGSTAAIKEQFVMMDSSGDNRISYDEFMMAMGVTPDNGNVDKSALMRRIFLKFDKDGNGKIDEKELQSAMKEMGKHFTDKQLQDIMRQADKDNSGGLDYEEFIEHVQQNFQNHDAFEQFFREADSDNSGTLTLKELAHTLRNHGYKGSDNEIKRMFGETDFSGDNSISFEEYMIAMGRQPQEVHSGAIMRQVFLDFDQNGDGHIDNKELREAFKVMGNKVSRRKVKKIMKKVDKDGSGALDYEEFIQAVMNAN